jgi:hypothetical protein
VAAELGLYSIANRTVAWVDRSKMLSTRLIYVPSVRANAVIDQNKLVFIDTIEAGDPVAVNDYIEQRELEVVKERNMRQAVMASRQAVGGGAPVLECGSKGIYPGPVADLGKSARVEAIGVYESSDGVHGVGIARKAGTVQVRVRKSAKPLILSLSSYEPVRWVLTLEPGAELAAVLTSGFHTSEVLGAPNVRAYAIGRYYAYKRGSNEFASLDREVRCWTGKSVDVFQGSYSGESFVTGL